MAMTIDYSAKNHSQSARQLKITYYLLFGEGGNQHAGTFASHIAFAFKFPLVAIDCR